jgi:hypothetical protein
LRLRPLGEKAATAFPLGLQKRLGERVEVREVEIAVEAVESQKEGLPR